MALEGRSSLFLSFRSINDRFKISNMCWGERRKREKNGNFYELIIKKFPYRYTNILNIWRK